MLGSGPQLCQIVPEGLPETEPDLCSGSIPDSATLVQLHVQKQRPMMAHGCAAMTVRKEGTPPNANRGRAHDVRTQAK